MVVRAMGLCERAVRVWIRTGCVGGRLLPASIMSALVVIGADRAHVVENLTNVSACADTHVRSWVMCVLS
jgi:hypothetical protein